MQGRLTRKLSRTFSSGYILFICLLILSALLTGGCAQPQAKIMSPLVTAPAFPSFVVVKPQPGDTLSSLASKYLNNPSMDWLIADFNEIADVTPGQELIIPLKPYERGGLTITGYQTVPVLSYHSFSETKGDKMTVPVNSFYEQMQYLKDNGYRVITMDQLFGFLDFKGQIPKKSVVITIDDGWRSFYDLGYPILKIFGYPATFFIYTDLITGSRKTVSWDLLREMANNGIDMQSHTRTHRNLAATGEKESFKEYYEAIDRELSDSARIIREKLNKDVKYLAYPYGSTNHIVIALLKKHGYSGAFTSKRGGNPFFINNYMLNRSMVSGDFDLIQFEKLLTSFSNEAIK